MSLSDRVKQLERDRAELIDLAQRMLVAMNGTDQHYPQSKDDTPQKVGPSYCYKWARELSMIAAVDPSDC